MELFPIINSKYIHHLDVLVLEVKDYNSHVSRRNPLSFNYKEYYVASSLLAQDNHESH